MKRLNAFWRSAFLFCVLTWGSLVSFGQSLYQYKSVDTSKLYVEVYYPPALEEGVQYPAMIFYFGGGWKGGDRSHFEHHAQYFSARGMVCFLADYRTRNKHQTTPFEALADAKSAMRYIRKHAKQFQIDPDRIVAAGGSAGGHLAAATALIETYDDPRDDLTISCIPNALVLFNPVIDNCPGGYGFEQIGEAYKDFSPLHNLRSDMPPSIMLLGTADDLIPVETAEYFAKAIERLGGRCDLLLYEGRKHGFFNYRFKEDYEETVAEVDAFLQSLGYLGER